MTRARQSVANMVASSARFSVMSGRVVGPVDDSQRRVYEAIGESYDMNRHGGNGSQVAALTDEFTDTFAIVGSPARCVERIAGQLRQCDYVDEQGERRKINLDDILVVAPYNLQVRLLKRALGQKARVGTIDKFQGQEAVAVIISMCASAPDASPRGLDFLLDKNRLNVAISRAKCLAIIVGHPSLGRGRCTTLRQMNLSNLFCRAVAEACG